MKNLLFVLLLFPFLTFGQVSLDAKLRAKDSQGRGLSQRSYKNADSVAVNVTLPNSATLNTAKVSAKLKSDSIASQRVFKGTAIVAQVRNFVRAVHFQGLVVKPTDVVHLYWIFRNAVSGATPTWMVAVGINGTRIAQFKDDNFVEPAADANGERISTIALTPISPYTVNANMTVNWSAIPSGTPYYYFADAGARSFATLFVETQPTLTTIRGTITGTTAPRRIYTLLNDVDSRNIVPGSPGPLRQDSARQYSATLYLDRFIRAHPLNTDIRWASTGSDRVRIASPRLNDNDATVTHPTPTTAIPVSLTIAGNTDYADKVISTTMVSTRESTGASTLVAYVKIGDSTVEGLNTEVGVPPGYARRSFGVVQEQFLKAQIDYLLGAGYTVSQAQSLSGITSPDLAKHKAVCVGTNTTNLETTTFTYRGVSRTFSVRAEGRGSWANYMYMNKPALMIRAQGTWDALGLGNGSGTDYTGSTTQMYLFDRTAFTPANFVDTPASRSWASQFLGYTGTTTADYVARMNTLAASPVNPFYDQNIARTYTDANGNVWTVRFSVKKYLDRYRTMDDAGVRLSQGAGTMGTSVVSVNDYDVMKPTHILLQLCVNDLNITWFGNMVKAFTDGIKADYVANSLGTPNIALDIIAPAGTYFPKLYPEVGTFSAMNEALHQIYDDNTLRAQTAILSEDANRVFILNNTHITPTAKAVLTRSANSPEYDLTGDIRDAYQIPSRTSSGILIHPNAVAHRVWGVQDYAWIKYTLGF